MLEIDRTCAHCLQHINIMLMCIHVLTRTRIFYNENSDEKREEVAGTAAAK